MRFESNRATSESLPLHSVGSKKLRLTVIEFLACLLHSILLRTEKLLWPFNNNFTGFLIALNYITITWTTHSLNS